MAIIPLQERRWRELGALAASLALSQVPLLYWVAVNAEFMTIGGMASEMRIVPAGSSGPLVLLAAHRQQDHRVPRKPRARLVAGQFGKTHLDVTHARSSRAAREIAWTPKPMLRSSGW